MIHEERTGQAALQALVTIKVHACTCSLGNLSGQWIIGAVLQFTGNQKHLGNRDGNPVVTAQGTTGLTGDRFL